MKTKQILTVLTGVLFLSVLVSCKKKDDETATPETPTITAAAAGTIQWTADGTTFNSVSTSTMAIYSGSGYSISGPQITASKNLALSIFCDKALSVPVTFTLSAVNIGNYQTEWGTSNAKSYLTNASNTGTCTITKYDATAKKMSGTFSFKAINGGVVKEVTSGSFTDVKVY
jgi:hypothetical protein